MRVGLNPLTWLAVALALAPALAGAEVIHNSGEIAQSFVADNPAILACIGEGIQIDCVFRWQETVVIRPNGRINVQFHANDRACAGVGVDSGTNYTRVGADNYHFSGNAVPPLQETFTSALNLIAPGPGNNILFLYRWNLIVNANGDTVVFVDDFRTKCR